MGLAENQNQSIAEILQSDQPLSSTNVRLMVDNFLSMVSQNEIKDPESFNKLLSSNTDKLLDFFFKCAVQKT